MDKATRSAAEGLLHGWEADAAPGFLSGLMRIVEQRDNVPEVGELGAAGWGWVG